MANRFLPGKVCSPAHGLDVSMLINLAVGEALDCPARTFNLTLLRQHQMIWDLSSIEDGDVEPVTVGQFLKDNDCRRSIVVLDVSNPCCGTPTVALNISSRRLRKRTTSGPCGHFWCHGNLVCESTRALVTDSLTSVKAM